MNIYLTGFCYLITVISEHFVKRLTNLELHNKNSLNLTNPVSIAVKFALNLTSNGAEQSRTAVQIGY
jgi:hypothetical protein